MAMTETLPGLELTATPMTIEADYDQYAVRAINAVRVSFIEDQDKLRQVISAGGSHLEMRAAVDAHHVIAETIRGLDLAIDRVLGHDEGENDEHS